MNKIGFIGLGRMGTPMAANLIKAGYNLVVYNRTPRMSSLQEMGAKFVNSPGDVVRESEVIITMLSDNKAVESIVFGHGGIMEEIKPGQIYIDMSTVSPALARKIASAVEAKGAEALDAPVAGSVKPATEGTLVIMVGGRKEVFEKCREVLAKMGKTLIFVGDHGMGLIAKLAVNTLLGLTTQALAESVTLARKAGIKTEDILEIITASAVGNSPYIKTKAPLIADGKYPVAFSVEHIHKDLGFALAEAHKNGVIMPAAAVAYEMFNGARARGLGEDDLMSVIKVIEQMSGLK